MPRFGNKVVLCEWVEKIAVGRPPAAELKTVMRNHDIRDPGVLNVSL